MHGPGEDWEMRDTNYEINTVVSEPKPMPSYWTLAEEVTHLHGQLGKLQSENAKLRDENARLRSCLSDDSDNARQIIGENHKLRELVRDMAEFGDGDWRYTPLSRTKHDDMRREFAERMREFGIEVD